MVTTIGTDNALSRFVKEARALFVKEPDLEKRWTELSLVLAKLLADPEVMRASAGWPECIVRDGRAENLLFYEDPEFGFAINGLTKGDNRQGPPGAIHDHAHIFTLYGVLDGHERMERYERIDDRSIAGFAQIKQTVNQDVGPGEIDLVRPYEVHREVATGERTVAIIIRSEKSGAFNQGRYDPQTNRYWESLGPVQTPCEMLPD